MTRSTIAALASGRPPAAIAIIRISGPFAIPTLSAVLGGSLPAARHLSLRCLRDPASGTILDEALVAVFPGPTSATGEDCVELHLHGGPAVVSDVLATLVRLEDVRLALPGEFTRRAFANGRLDLAQVEGLADLVAAETSGQRQQALALTGGTLSRLADAWRTRLIDLLAEAEAALDFGEDEDDVATRLVTTNGARLASLAEELDALVNDSNRAARIRDGLVIVVAGAPNVGKSSLVNALAMRDAAIVTAIPGTTRDAIEVGMDLGGIAATLIDTAGLREASDPVEQEGIRRARARAAAADLVLHIIAAGDPLPDAASHSWIVTNKSDLQPDAPALSRLAVSALTGDGVAALHSALVSWAHAALRPGEPALLGHARHREAFEAAAACLRRAAASEDVVLRADDLRSGTQALARIAGRVDVDDVLDRIFSTFCIGK